MRGERTREERVYKSVWRSEVALRLRLRWSDQSLNGGGGTPHSQNAMARKERVINIHPYAHMFREHTHNRIYIQIHIQRHIQTNPYMHTISRMRLQFSTQSTPHSDYCPTLDLPQYLSPFIASYASSTKIIEQGRRRYEMSL